MSTLFSIQSHLFFSPLFDRTRPPNRVLYRTPGFFKHKQLLNSPSTAIGGSVLVRSGLSPSFPDPEATQGLLRELLGRAEGLLYTIADAAVTSSDAASASKQSGDWLSGITNYLESVLKVLKDALSTLHVPYSYGFAIILLTVLVKAATFPLTKRQVESAMAVRSLQPQIKAIQQRYAGDQERIQLETARLYKLAGVNPLAGCLPTLATIPVWIGLYRALSNVADEGLLTEGFFWIPSLSGPTTIAARQNGSGISWLFPFVDGHPPLGWSDTAAYLVLPVLLVISQYISVQIMQSSQGNDPNQKTSQALTNFLPLMIGYFALSVPSGLSLYWFTNNILSTAQQVWLQKLGGVKSPIKQYTDATMKSERPDILNSIPQVDSKKVEPIKEEKEASWGLGRGERFKQIKEQEARRRKQREEEMRRAEEAAKGTGIVNEKLKQETELVTTEDGRGQSVTVTHNSTDAGAASINSNQSTQYVKEDQTEIVVSKVTNGEASCSSGTTVKDEPRSSEHHKKESVEVYSNRDKGSVEQAALDRREEASEKDEV